MARFCLILSLEDASFVASGWIFVVKDITLYSTLFLCLFPESYYLCEKESSVGLICEGWLDGCWFKTYVMVEDGILFLNEVDSTNAYMRLLLDGAEETVQEGLMVCAEYQSQGRGQMDNRWESARGENLLFSLLLYPTFVAPSDMFLISQSVSLGVKDMLNDYCGLSDISIKWPNDIYWRDKKIAGILVENFISGHTIESSIVGIGININQKEFFSDAPNPVSVTQITGKEFNVDECAAVVRKAILDRYIYLLNAKLEQLRGDYFSALYRREGYFPYRDAAGEFSAQIEEVLPQGTLILSDTEGRRREYSFKEVEFVI